MSTPEPVYDVDGNLIASAPDNVPAVHGDVVDAGASDASVNDENAKTTTVVQPVGHGGSDVEVEKATDPLKQHPLGADGTPLVPGTPDTQIVADRNDAPTLVVHEHLTGVVEDLDKVIASLGDDLSKAVLSEHKYERVAGVGLRIALEALQSARDVVNSFAPEGATRGGPVGTRSGVV